MLKSVQQGRGICRCFLQSETTGVCSKQIREYQNPYTQVFERIHPLGLVGKGKYPRLKAKSFVLKRVMPEPGKYSFFLNCILTREVKGLGLQGEVVSVNKDVFRNELYVTGKAVYASPENLKKYEKYRKIHEELGLSYAAKLVVERLSLVHLPIYMSATNPWTLNKAHVRIAFRRIDIMVTDDNISLPAKPITQHKTFILDVNLNQMIFTKVRATIYPTEKGEAINPDIDHKIWDNEPVVKDQPVWIVTPNDPPPAHIDSETHDMSDDTAGADVNDDVTKVTNSIADITAGAGDNVGTKTKRRDGASRQPKRPTTPKKNRS